MERWTSLRHNQAHARWLLTYLRRWLVAGTLLLCTAVYADVTLALPALAAVFYVACVLALVFIVVTGLSWLSLRLDRRIP